MWITYEIQICLAKFKLSQLIMYKNRCIDRLYRNLYFFHEGLKPVLYYLLHFFLSFSIHEFEWFFMSFFHFSLLIDDFNINIIKLKKIVKVVNLYYYYIFL